MTKHGRRIPERIPARHLGVQHQKSGVGVDGVGDLLQRKQKVFFYLW